MQQYIQDMIKYRLQAGENKEKVIMEMFHNCLITKQEARDELNVEFLETDFYDIYEDVWINFGTVSYQTLKNDFSALIADKIMDIFYALLSNPKYSNNNNHRITEITTNLYNDLYVKSKSKGENNFFDKEYQIDNKKFIIGFNYKD